MLSLTDSEHQMLLRIYQQSQGDTRVILNRKEVISAMGLGKSDGEQILGALTRHGLIRYKIFASLCITKTGLAEAELRMSANQTQTGERPTDVASGFPLANRKTARCYACFGTGRSYCLWCQGTGRKLCTACGGSGQKWMGRSSMNPSGYGICPSCAGGGGRVMCSCGGRKVVCRACGGSGKARA
jgi:hypothetical protein